MIEIYNEQHNTNDKLTINANPSLLKEFLDKYFEKNKINLKDYNFQIKKNTLSVNVVLITQESDKFIDKLKLNLEVFLKKIIDREKYNIIISY